MLTVLKAGDREEESLSFLAVLGLSITGEVAQRPSIDSNSVAGLTTRGYPNRQA